MNPEVYVWHSCVTLKDGINEDPFLANIPPEKLLVVEIGANASKEITLSAIRPEYIGKDAAFSFTKENFNKYPSNRCFVSKSLKECQEWYVARMNFCIDVLDRRIEELDEAHEVACAECKNCAKEVSRDMEF